MSDNLDNVKKGLNDLGSKASELAGAAKEKAVEAADKFKESDLGKSILGEDGKFDKDDAQRLAQDLKDSKVGKAVLGEDGKFDKEDVDRITADVTEKAKGLIDKVKDALK